MEQSIWVYILENAQTRSYTIGVCSDIAKLMQNKMCGLTLVYKRSFYSTLDAFAHKLLLERISVNSLIFLLKAGEWKDV